MEELEKLVKDALGGLDEDSWPFRNQQTNPKADEEEYQEESDAFELRETTDPTSNQWLWTATPISPVWLSRATME